MPDEARAFGGSSGRLFLVKVLAVVFSGILFSLNCYLSQGFPRIFLPFLAGSELAFSWASAAGILMGAGFSLLARAANNQKNKSERIKSS